MARFPRSRAVLAGALLGTFFLAGSSVAADSSAKKTIGLALTSWDFATYQTPDGHECPDGFQATNKDNWQLQFPTQKARAEYTQKYLYLGPLGLASPVPQYYLGNRGPHGQSVVTNPTIVKDLVPLREPRSKIAYGFNLSGNSGGRPSPKQCPHEKFTDPDGNPGIDNQLYRVLGCASAWRERASVTSFFSAQMREPRNRVLIEITGVDDERNSEHVEVGIYKGVDGFIPDASGNPTPWYPQRVDVRFPGNMVRTTGKIVDGVLTTEPADLSLALVTSAPPGAERLRDMRLRLKLTDNGATGMIGGYENLREWWLSYRNTVGHSLDSATLWSPPAVYEAVHRLADGYPDPQTGECTAISAAYRVNAVRSLIVWPRSDDPLIVDANFKAAQRTVTAPNRMLASQVNGR